MAGVTHRESQLDWRKFTEDFHELRPHQVKALAKLDNGKILWGKPGSGKSLVAATYYKEREAPKHVYVITTARKRDSFDWHEEFYRIGIGPLSGPRPIPEGNGKVRARRNQPQEGSGTDGSSCEGVGSVDNVLPGLSEPGSCVQAGGRQRIAHSKLLRRGGGGISSNDGQSPLQVGLDRSSSSRDIDGGSGGSRPETGVEGSEHGDFGRVPQGHDQSGNADLDDPRNDRRLAGFDEASGLILEGDRSGSDSFLGEAGTYPWVLTVDSWNNIAKYANVAGAFFIFDEQRLVGSGDWTRKFLRIAKHNNWILLSGTPGDTWLDYIPVLVANNFYKNRTAFKREHVVYNTFTKFPKVDRYINVGKLMRLRSKLLVEMPYERHTKRRIVEVPLPYDKEALEMVLKKRWHIYENRPLRDVAEMFSVGRRLVNSDPSRLEMVKELWKNHPKLIVFYNFNYELESLRSLKDCYSRTSESITSNGFATSSSSLALLGEATKTSLLSSRIAVTPSPSLEWSGIQSKNGSIDTLKDSSRSTSEVSISEWNGLGEVGWENENSPGKSSKSSPDRSSSTGLRHTKKNGLSGSSTETVPAKLEAYSIAEWNGHKHQPIPSSTRWLYLVQYTAGAEAWNCVETDAMIMHSRNYSWKVTEQAYGRIDRLNTPFKDLWYYDFTSDSFIDRAIGRSLKAKETFNEAKYARLFDV